MDYLNQVPNQPLPNAKRDVILSSLYTYRPYNDEESRTLAEFIKFVQKTPNCFDRSNQEGHITAGGFVCRCTPEGGIEIALIESVKATDSLDRWWQPGGHADGNPDTHEVAKQEVCEEIGLCDVETLLDGGILDIQIYENAGSNHDHRHYDVRYLFQVPFDSELKPQYEEMISAKWCNIDEILQNSSGNDMIRVMMKIREIFRL